MRNENEKRETSPSTTPLVLTYPPRSPEAVSGYLSGLRWGTVPARNNNPTPSSSPYLSAVVVGSGGPAPRYVSQPVQIAPVLCRRCGVPQPWTTLSGARVRRTTPREVSEAPEATWTVQVGCGAHSTIPEEGAAARARHLNAAGRRARRPWAADGTFGARRVRRRMDEDYLASNPAEDTSSTGESDDEHYASENALPAETEVEPNPAEDTLLSFGLPESNQFLLMEANGKPEPARDAASRRRLFLDHLKPGQQIDVLDSVDKWAEAEVLQVDYSRRRVEVTFLFWSDRWNTWIEFGTPAGAKRLAEPGTKTYQEGGVLQLNHRIECCDGDVWREAVVIDTTPLQVKVHFMKWHSKFDEWLERDSPRIRPFGRKKRIAILKQQQARKRRQVLMKPAADAVERRERTISSRSDCYTHYVGALEKLQLFVYNVEGDGNCLFRAVAHQVYGDDELHKLVRKACCDYMEREATFFEQFVEGDREDFLRYLTYKRRNAVWGDDPEVQALCEIYNRSAEIWAYDHRIGARKLRTFHEPLESTVEAETAETPSAAVPGDDATRPGRPASSASPSPEPVGDRGRSEIREEPGLPVPDAAAAIPMRLSYYGGGHYDSIVTRDHVRVISRLRPGMLEEAALQRSDAREPRRVRSNSAAEAQNPPSEGKEEEAELDLALEASRLDFDAQFEDLDAALVASVESYEKDMGSAQVSASGGSGRAVGSVAAVL
eukprot:scaffold7335_cov289-Pinguiococcus_pyrenoidosus.AAC.6